MELIKDQLLKGNDQVHVLNPLFFCSFPLTATPLGPGKPMFPGWPLGPVGPGAPVRPSCPAGP